MVAAKLQIEGSSFIEDEGDKLFKLLAQFIHAELGQLSDLVLLLILYKAETLGTQYYEPEERLHLTSESPSTGALDYFGRQEALLGQVHHVVNEVALQMYRHKNQRLLKSLQHQPQDMARLEDECL